MRSNVDATADRVAPARLILPLALVVLLDNEVVIGLFVTSGQVCVSLTQLGHLSEAPIGLCIVRFEAIFGRLGLFKHRSAELVPFEQLRVVCLVLVKLFLETNLEAGLQQVILHLCGRVKRVPVDACGCYFHEVQVLIVCDHLVVHGRLASVIWVLFASELTL